MAELERVSDLLAGGVVRIWGPHGQAEGGGVLVSPLHVVTCAHVVANVIPGSTEEQRDVPVGTVMVDFPALGSHERLRAHPLREGWCPVDDRGGGDVAVLELEDPIPPGAAPPPLLRPSSTKERKVIAEGFPVQYTGRITSENRVVADAGPEQGEWLQLAVDGTNGFQIEHGYSGTPLWDRDAEAVLGIALGKDGGARGAFMIPTRVLAEVWQPLEQSIGWRLRFDAERDEHWRPCARGVRPGFDGERDADGMRGAHVLTSNDGGWLFTGREQILRELVGWIERPDRYARVVRGAAGCGKSAVLGRLVTLSDSEERAKTPIAHAPAGTVPPVGSIDLAIVVKDKSLQETVETIGHWLDIEAATPKELRDQLNRRRLVAPPPLLVVDQLDSALDPKQLVRYLLQPLAESGSARLLIGLKRREQCPLADALAPHAKMLDLDEQYLDDAGMKSYVRRLLVERGPTGYASASGQDHVASRVASEVTKAATPSFLVAQLSALWHCEQPDVVERPPQTYPKGVARAMNDYLEAAGARLSEGTERQAERERALRDLLTGLAYARGPGLPVQGRTWPEIAGAIHSRTYQPKDVDWLLDTPAAYLLQSVDADGERGRRLFHEALGDCLRADHEDEAIETAIVERLGGLCNSAGVKPVPRYVALRLPAHVAAIDDWESLGGQPDVLDRLDPGAVRAEALRSGLLQGSLPLPIAGVVRSSRLMTRSQVGDRTGLRQLGMARGSRQRSFGRGDAAQPIAAWTVRSAVLRQDAAHLTFDAPASVRAVTTFSGPDEVPVLVAGCEDGSVQLWSAATGDRFGYLLPADLHREDGVRALAACDPGSGVRLVVAMRRGSVRIWDPMRAEETSSFDAHRSGTVRSIAAFASDGALRVVTGGSDEEVCVWDSEGNPLLLLAGGAPVRTLAVGLLEGRVCLLAGSDDGRVRVWEDIAGQLRADAAEQLWADAYVGPTVATRELVGPVDWVRGVCAFEGPDGSWIGATGDECKLMLWPAQEHEPKHRLDTRGQRTVLGLVVYSDSGEACIATCGASASVELWNTAQAVPIGQPLVGHRGDACAIAAYEIGGGPRIVTGGEDKTVRIWNPASAAGPLATGSASYDGPVHALAALDGVVIAGGADGRIRAWDPTSGELAAGPFDAGVGAVRALATGPYSGVAIGGEETVRFLDPLTGVELAEPLVGHSAPVRALVAGLRTEDGQAALASGSEDGTVRLWSLDAGTEILSARSRHRGPLRALVALEIPGTGTCLAVVGEDREFVLRQLAGGTVGTPFPGHIDWPMAACSYAAAAVPVLVTAGDDCTVRNWNPHTKKPLALLGQHDGAVKAVVALVRRCQDVRIVSGGEDETVRVWDPSAPPGKQQRHRLELGVRVNALSVLGDAVLVGTDEGHLVVELS